MFSGILGSVGLGDFALGFGAAEPEDPSTKNVSQSMLTQTVTFDTEFVFPFGQTMLSSSVEAFYREASNTLFDTALANSIFRDQTIQVDQFLGFTERTMKPISNFIGFSDSVREAQVIDVSNFFFTNPDDQNAIQQEWVHTNTLGLTDDVEGVGEALGENLFGLENSVIRTGPISRDTTQGNFLRQTLSYSVDEGDDSCRAQEFAPLVGESTGSGFGPMPTTPPTLSDATLTLTFPRVSPTTTLVLNDPEFGNGDTLTFTRIDRTTRGGDRKIFSDPKWSQWERLELSVRGLCEATADDIIAFLNASLGKEIGLLDWEGRNWSGFVVNPETDVTEEQSGFAFQFVFEGTLV